MLTIGSLFSGIGGLELGLEWAGLGPVRWQVERKARRRADLSRGWPDAKRYDDVRSVGAHNLERVDLICGGFPCVEVSSCGRKGGLVGESGLWAEFARIVGELGPRYVVVENVSALAARGLDAVLGTLSDLGFDAEWSDLPACAVGAPFPRPRLFVVAYADRDREPTRPVYGEAPIVRSSAGATWNGWPVADGPPRVADGVPDDWDRNEALGNAVVPQVAEVVGWVVRGIHERLTRCC